MPIDVKDAAGVTRTLQVPNSNGRASAGNSRPMVLSSEDLAVLQQAITVQQQMVTLLQGTLATNDQLGSPITYALAVTPGDTALNPVPRALYVGTGGSLVMRGSGGSVDQTWANVPSSSMIPFRAQYIRATSTAADILALY